MQRVWASSVGSTTGPLTGCGGGSFEVEPVGGAEDVGVAFALPDVGVDVGSCSVATSGEEGHAKVQSDGIEGLQALGQPVAYLLDR